MIYIEYLMHMAKQIRDLHRWRRIVRDPRRYQKAKDQLGAILEAELGNMGMVEQTVACVSAVSPALVWLESRIHNRPFPPSKEELEGFILPSMIKEAVKMKFIYNGDGSVTIEGQEAYDSQGKICLTDVRRYPGGRQVELKRYPIQIDQSVSNEPAKVEPPRSNSGEILMNLRDLGAADFTSTEKQIIADDIKAALKDLNKL